MRRRIAAILIAIGLTGTLVWGSYWVATQPVWLCSQETVAPAVLRELPVSNRKIVTFVERQGKRLAPSYAGAVCTEFLIAATEAVTPLTRAEKKCIRIMTDENLVTLVKTESPVIKGIQTALLQNHKGVPVSMADVKPGDLVQFWNLYNGKAYGHCGIILDIVPGKSLTLYSSHPLTDGYGKQLYCWPDYAFFVRLN